ncbi:hypothetical protein AVEN_12452-1 [Araneus ventricosus]|uniref:Uncharacterized protein n=1 Tax=Araneus ventricosus TaxID=182803 RepID=A0A4Y2MW46_ARAVE|nr:hypothetical protein AVEN_12452-1 [Araneus ventricosus]
MVKYDELFKEKVLCHYYLNQFLPDLDPKGQRPEDETPSAPANIPLSLTRAAIYRHSGVLNVENCHSRLSFSLQSLIVALITIFIIKDRKTGSVSYRRSARGIYSTQCKWPCHGKHFRFYENNSTLEEI